MDRNEILDRVRARKTPWDIVVIGGGATGVGCAVDAASRGYDVLLLEQHDFGKGTSSRSTKLVHGGVRYLKQGNISLVRESLRERGMLLRNAPHTVETLAFIVPCYSHWQRLYYGIGLKIYDLLSGKFSLGRSRILSASETSAALPTIAAKGLAGGVLYFDGRFDDTRLLIDLVRTAHEIGAAILNYAEVSTIAKNTSGTVSGVRFRDRLTGTDLDVSAKVVINAAGAFCDPVRSMSDERAKPIVTLSQGIHVVLDKRFLPTDTAVMIPKTSDGRVLFCIPWHGHTLVGTTDTPIEAAVLEPKAMDAEINFVLNTAGRYLRHKPARSDIMSVFTGIRPLVRSGTAKSTSALSRGHTISVDAAGLLTITGGKWTTYRHMAEDAVDQAAKMGGLAAQRSITETLRIPGPKNMSSSEAAPLSPDLPYTREDVIRAMRNEMARTVEDVLARRTRALFLNAGAALAMAPAVARIMADGMGKDNEWIERQLAEFREVASGYEISH